MPKPTPTVSAATPLDAAWAKVRAGFDGFIGNTDAVYALQRGLVAAFVDAPAGQPPVLSKSYLFVGPPSVGKTELARRVTTVLDLPLVFLDGHGLRNRERLFEYIDGALDAHDLHPQLGEPRSGVTVLNYPSFAVFVDEAHKIGAGTQDSLLKMLEADDRSVTLDGKRGRRIAMVNKAAFLFATTRVIEINRALRTRCTEISLQRYTEAEVALMVRQRFPNLPDAADYSAIATIAACARDVPRIAFEMARDVEEESKTAPNRNIRACVRNVMNGRGIIYANGVTKNDYAYLMLLKHEGRPLGEGAIRAQLQGEIDAAQIVEDIEPFVFAKKFVTSTAQGRQLTYEGKKFLEEAKNLREQGYDDRLLPV